MLKADMDVARYEYEYCELLLRVQSAYADLHRIEDLDLEKTPGFTISEVLAQARIVSAEANRELQRLKTSPPTLLLSHTLVRELTIAQASLLRMISRITRTLGQVGRQRRSRFGSDRQHHPRLILRG